MIYGKVWLVVKPTVGIPLFFIGVVTLAMLVHFAILTHTTWFAAYWQGNAKKVSAVMPDSGPPVVKLIG